jgi:hypothetical protein
MATEIGEKTLVIKEAERTWRTEIFTEFGEDPVIRVHREMIGTSGDQVITRDRNIPVVERRFSQIFGKTYGGQTGEGMATAIAAWADGLRAEDVANISQNPQLNPMPPVEEVDVSLDEENDL